VENLKKYETQVLNIHLSHTMEFQGQKLTHSLLSV